MKLSDYINEKWLQPTALSEAYALGDPFPHIVMDDFFKKEILDEVLMEFPDLESLESAFHYSSQESSKFASIGSGVLSRSAFNLISFLNSDVYLSYLKSLASISEQLIGDPYLEGGGYHEIKNGGYLKVHTDFNKHPNFNLERRLNVLIYLNKDWESTWGGKLGLYKKDNLKKPIKSVTPNFNKVVVFSTNNQTFHGHPEPLTLSEGISRKSIALYYYSDSVISSDIPIVNNGTDFRTDTGGKFLTQRLSGGLSLITPPIIIKLLKSFIKK
ncbi:2OG-Fe(II) oxygenase [Colwellia sp. BRX8-7]|uniref:2OG-Fe(II) oxygenase n=1 Tax=Colwellia sp. BRX8-7 TaxID=2759833 RepID=UPI0015F5458F|nr:2OG-Fe(II) oxygenase [Colwellia sp. BRX8-7]MBA6335676.1 2OG-Fe(II) oxygenase [Colwellia sp. BRX8-7]